MKRTSLVVCLCLLLAGAANATFQPVPAGTVIFDADWYGDDWGIPNPPPPYDPIIDMDGSQYSQLFIEDGSGIGGTKALRWDFSPGDWDLYRYLRFDYGHDTALILSQGNALDITFKGAVTNGNWGLSVTLDRWGVQNIYVPGVTTQVGDWTTISFQVGTGANPWLWGEARGIGIFVNAIGTTPSDNTLWVDNITLTPEPATMAILGLGSLFALRRRKA